MKRSMIVALAGTLTLASALTLGGCRKEEPVQAPPIRTTSTPRPAATPPPAEPTPTEPAPVTIPTTAPAEAAPKATNVTPTTQPTVTPPATQPAIEMPAAASPKENPLVATFSGFAGPKPATWIWHPTTRQFAVAEYAVPGRDGADQGRIVVSTANAPLDMNIARWKSQFRTGPEGGEVEPTVSKVEADGLSIDVVEFAGEYRGMGAGFSPDQIMIVGIVPNGSQQVYVRFTGPSKTVSANREAFMELLRGLKRVEPGK